MSEISECAVSGLALAGAFVLGDSFAINLDFLRGFTEFVAMASVVHFGPCLAS